MSFLKINNTKLNRAMLLRVDIGGKQIKYHVIWRTKPFVALFSLLCDFSSMRGSGNFDLPSEGHRVELLALFLWGGRGGSCRWAAVNARWCASSFSFIPSALRSLQNVFADTNEQYIVFRRRGCRRWRRKYIVHCSVWILVLNSKQQVGK